MRSVHYNSLNFRLGTHSNHYPIIMILSLRSRPLPLDVTPSDGLIMFSRETGIDRYFWSMVTRKERRDNLKARHAARSYTYTDDYPVEWLLVVSPCFRAVVPCRSLDIPSRPRD